VYFAYYLVSASIKKIIHWIIWLPLIPVLILNFSKYSNLIFSIESNNLNCVEHDEIIYYYIYFLAVAYLGWLIKIILAKYFSKNTDELTKKRVKIVIYAVAVLILWFVVFARLQNYVGDNALLFVPLGMVIFIGMLTYAISKYKLFNIKLLFAQAIVIGLTFFLAAELFFAESTINRILILITLFISIGFGYMLVKSVKTEIEQREKMEQANKIIAKRNKQLDDANKKITERNGELQRMATSLDEANEQLKIANGKLKQLDEAKSAFFSRAAHDLRTPITAINGYVSLVMEGSYGVITEEAKTALNKTFGVAKNMAALVEDFLTAAKLEAGGMNYIFAKYKIEDICQQIVETLYPKSKDRGLYLDFKKPDEALPELLIDGSRIRESVSNLVDNAIKYTEKGGITIKVERAESSNHKPMPVNDPGEKATSEIVGPVVRITVSDTGMGSPKDGMQYLFARFSRGKGNAKFTTSGTGLGLYVCKGMIEDNGGKVWAESDGEGKGSRFIVELPVNPPANILEQAKNDQLEKKSETNSNKN
jgi:signal transduction histidine kinase